MTVGYVAFGTNIILNAKGNLMPRDNIYVFSLESDVSWNGILNKPYLTLNKSLISVNTA